MVSPIDSFWTRVSLSGKGANSPPLVLEFGYGQAGVVTPVVVYRVFPGAITEVQQVMPVALVLLLTNGHQIVGEYPDLDSVPPRD